MKKIIGLTTGLLITGILMTCIFSCTTQSGSPKLGTSPLEKVVAAMTLEQKARLVVGLGMSFDIPDSIAKKLFPDGNNPFAVNPDSLNLNDSTILVKNNIVPGAAGFTAGYTTLNIPQMVLSDGPAGLRISPKRKDDNNTYFATAFPVGTLLASTWDTALVNQVGKAMGNEVLEYGVDIILGPGVNIHRNPLCGRNFEYYSEDPYLTGNTAAAMINGIQSNGVGTSLKHFAANNQETSRTLSNSVMTERALREIYLKGFQIAVEKSQPWTIMSSYNYINGTYTSQSHDLLTDILRDEWGFKGFVTTDWTGGDDPIAQMNAGNDMLQPGTLKQVQDIIKAVKDGKLDAKVLDKNVERILNVVLLSPKSKGYKFSNKPDLKAHAQIVRSAAAEGMILLKNNNNALPLDSKIKNVAVFGNTSIETVTGGTGSGDVNEEYTISIADGLKNAGLICDETLFGVYKSYIDTERAKAGKNLNPIAELLGAKAPVKEMPVDAALAAKYAGNNDIALVTIGRNAGEGADRVVEGDFNLTDVEKKLISNVTKAFQAKGKKTIVVLNIGGVIETTSWKDIPDAILLAWQPGEEAGNSVADILTGKVNPSGKLTSTFPVKYSDDPSAKNFPGKEVETDKSKPVPEMFGQKMVPMEVDYEEDIYVGYRYYNTFNIPVSYEFGYGLSYTQFTFNNLKLSSDKFAEQVTVSIDILNSGQLAGREVAELYLSAPGTKLKKPSEELKGYVKTKLLNPGEKETVSFTISKNELASFDAASSSWVAEAGTYTVKIGASSKDIRQNGTFSLDSDMVVTKVHKAMAPQKEIKMLY